MWQPHRVCLQDQLPLCATVVCLQRPQRLQRQQWWTGLWWVCDNHPWQSWGPVYITAVIWRLNVLSNFMLIRLIWLVRWFQRRLQSLQHGNKIVCSRSEWGAISQHLSLLWNITQWGSGRWWWRGSHHSPSPALCLSLRAPQIYELSGGMDLHLCVCVVALSLRGGRVHTSLFVLSLRSKHTRRGPPVSYRRPSLH